MHFEGTDYLKYALSRCIVMCYITDIFPFDIFFFNYYQRNLAAERNFWSLFTDYDFVC